MRTALITGISGVALSPEETSFLRSARPAGLILFARNCVAHDQIRKLIAAVKDAVGSDELLVLIDQEGGRVQRLRPPLGRALPPGAAYGARFAEDQSEACAAAFGAARLLADDLQDLGVNTNCAPVLDVPAPGSHSIIGDRAYGATPDQVATLGRAVAEGFLAGGVLPVIKHIPGHGRATKDSHLDLPIVSEPRAHLSKTDFAPFRALSDMPAAMTAHVVFTDIDPLAPASTSAPVTREIIRGEIGFDGLLMSDDVSMKALSGSIRDRAEAVIRSGSDVTLHCNGVLAEMSAAAEGSPPLAGEAKRRFDKAFSRIGRTEPYDRQAAEARLVSVLAHHARRTESV